MAGTKYNPYNAVSKIAGYKSDWEKANNSGDTSGTEQAAKNAQKYYDELYNNGWGKAADRLKNSTAEKAKTILNEVSTAGKTAIRPYLKAKAQKYGVSEDKINSMITYNDKTGEVSINGKSIGTPDALVDGTSYWDSDYLDKQWDEAVKSAGINTSVLNKVTGLYDMQVGDHDKLNTNYQNYIDQASQNPFETDVGKAIMGKYNLDAINGKNDALANATATNGGNIDSYAMANAQRQQAALTAQGQQAAINAVSAQLENIRTGINDMGAYNSDLYDKVYNTIGLQQGEEQRQFENDETAKNNEMARWEAQANITGYVPNELTQQDLITNNPYLNSDGTLKRVDDIDYMAIINNAQATIDNPNTTAAQKANAQQTINYANYARNKKIMDNYDRYGQWAETMIGIAPQETAQTKQFNAQLASNEKINTDDNATQRYVSNNNLAATKYASDSDLAATKYKSDNDLEGTKYVTDKETESAKYATDAEVSMNNANIASAEKLASANGLSEEEVKNNVDSEILDWLYSYNGLDDDGSTYKNYGANNNINYVAREKLSDNGIVKYIKSELVNSGYTAKEAEEKINEYKSKVALSIAKAEGKDTQDEDVIKSIYGRYGW